jgi:hypothetical protein
MTGVLVILAAGMLLPGCSRFIGEGVGTAMGPKGIYVQIQPISPLKGERPLGAYTRFELGDVTDAFEKKAPADFYAYLPEEFQKEILKKKLPDRPGKTLVANVAVMHYEDQSLVGIGQISPMEEVVARVQLVDKSTGKVIASANCIGRSRETVNAGVKKKAEGLAKAIVTWISDYYPKEGREGAEEEKTE